MRNLFAFFRAVPAMTEARPTIRLLRAPHEWAAALAIRVAVFVHEQKGPLDDEPDADDARAAHFVVAADDRIVGTARVVWLAPTVAKIGRVALLPEYRGRGWGRQLMLAAIRHCEEQGARQLVLHAQTAALGFYQRLAFVAEGPEFDEGGIPHRRMVRRLADG